MVEYTRQQLADIINASGKTFDKKAAEEVGPKIVGFVLGLAGGAFRDGMNSMIGALVAADVIKLVDEPPKMQLVPDDEDDVSPAEAN